MVGNMTCSRLSLYHNDTLQMYIVIVTTGTLRQCANLVAVPSTRHNEIVAFFDLRGRQYGELGAGVSPDSVFVYCW